MPKNFPDDALVRVVPDLPGSVGPWTTNLRREFVNVGAALVPFGGLRVESDESIANKTDFRPKNTRLQRLSIGGAFDRVAIYCSQIFFPGGFPSPLPIILDVRHGLNNTCSSFGTITYSPLANTDADLIVQDSGLIGNQLEIWARVDPTAPGIPAVTQGPELTLIVAMDRVGGGGGGFVRLKGPNTK